MLRCVTVTGLLVFLIVSECVQAVKLEPNAMPQPSNVYMFPVEELIGSYGKVLQSDSFRNANGSEQAKFVQGLMDILLGVNQRHNLSIPDDYLQEIAQAVVRSGQLRPTGLRPKLQMAITQLRVTTSYHDIAELGQSMTNSVRPYVPQVRDRVLRCGRGARFRRGDASCTSSCFAKTSQVTLADNRNKSVDQLQVGDRVQCVDGQGQIDYCDVIGSLHRQDDAKMRFLRLETDNGQTLKVTEDHLLFRAAGEASTFADAEDVYAGRLTVGDRVFVGTSGQLKPVRIAKIDTQVSVGFYAPLTSSGTIIVDGVLASCYSQFDSHTVSHYVMSGARLAYYYGPEWVKSGLLSEDEGGKMNYASLLQGFTEWLLGGKHFYKN